MRKRLTPTLLTLTLATTLACNRTTSDFANDHYVRRTPVIHEGTTGETVVAYRVEEWHREKHKAAQTTLFKQDKLNIDTSDDGHLKLASETMQTDKQVTGSTAPFRHLFWSIMLSGAFNTFADVAGEAFQTWSSNDAAVDIEKIETDGEIALDMTAD